MSHNTTTHVPDERDPRVADAISLYWKKNISIMVLLLTMWALFGLGAGILFADTLNAYYLGGYPLGFWFAQQGSILVFVVLIFVYAIWLNRLDKAHHEELSQMGVYGSSGDGNTRLSRPAHQTETPPEEGIIDSRTP